MSKLEKSPFLQSISRFMSVRRYSNRTIKTYLYWIKYFIRFSRMQHPWEMGTVEVGTPLGDIGSFRRSRKQIKLPTVLDRDEVSRLLSCMSGLHLIIASMLYGSG